MRVSILIALLLALPLTGCGGKKHPDPNARNITEWALTRGGTVTVNEADFPITRGKPLPDGDLTIERIDLDRQKITDADLEKLAGLTNIKHLGLHSAKITQKGIEKLLDFPTLTELELSYTGIDDKGLEKLKSLPKLEKLFLYGTKVTKEGVENFRKERPKVVIQR
ncbi:MAG: hypothetical protein IT428_27295 [Planctomycetaceae bacterium]|nr:hypothetical protein [Planctomycetaceae bacterium]